MSGRWQDGDVIIWIQTGTGQDSKTDSDIYLRFYDRNNSLLGWVHAYERVDLGGFEEGEINCGFLGNLSSHGWLTSLREQVALLGVRIENVSDDRPRWFPERICLDFRDGNNSFRAFEINEWIDQDDGERCFEVAPEPGARFEDVGFEHELEIEAGGPDERPES